MKAMGRNVLVAAAAVVATAVAVPTASAAVDTTPPSVPQNLRTESLTLSASSVLTWDPSTDTGGSGFYHYWVLIDGVQRYRPTAPSAGTASLFLLDGISAGPHAVTIQAVDHALNRSAPSAPITLVWPS
jgi:hypothetical protein